MICRRRLLVSLDFDLTTSSRPEPDALEILNPNGDREQESKRSKRQIRRIEVKGRTTTNQPRIGVLSVEPFVSGDGVFLSDRVGIQILLKQFRLKTKKSQSIDFVAVRSNLSGNGETDHFAKAVIQQFVETESEDERRADEENQRRYRAISQVEIFIPRFGITPIPR